MKERKGGCLTLGGMNEGGNKTRSERRNKGEGGREDGRTHVKYHTGDELKIGTVTEVLPWFAPSSYVTYFQPTQVQ